jgi:hypothetical protein
MSLVVVFLILPASSSTKNKIIRGGTVCLIRNSRHILSTSAPVIKLFDITAVTSKRLKINLTVFNFYRPSPSSSEAVPLLRHGAKTDVTFISEGQQDY